MKYATLFLVMAAGWLTLAIQYGGWAWALLWPTVSFALVGAAYAGAGVWMFGKRANGSMHPLALTVLLPFLLFTWTLWHLQRLTTRRPPNGQPAPGVWIGRRPLFGELPDPTATVIDLTAEFRVARGLCQGGRYRCLPMLDASVPELSAMKSLISDLAAAPGSLYIHCAQGHGRSAMIVAALLIARGHASSADDALSQLRSVRPRVRLNARQRALLDRWIASR